MAFGIEVYNNNNSFQFGTTVLEGFSAVSTGSVASYATLPYNTINEILGLRRSTTGAIIGSVTPGVNGSWYNSTSIAIDYLKLVRIRASTEDDVGTQGIRLLNTASEITYSSKFTRGQKLLHVYPPGTLAGTNIVYSGDLTGIYYATGRMLGANVESCLFDYTSNTITSYNNIVYNIPDFTYGGVYQLVVPKSNNSSTLIISRN
jgi:hypothetical protein